MLSHVISQCEPNLREQRRQSIKMNNKKRNLIFMRIIDHPDARGSINKSAAEICKEENV